MPTLGWMGKIQMQIMSDWDNNTKRFILIESHNSIYYGLNIEQSRLRVKHKGTHWLHAFQNGRKGIIFFIEREFINAQ